MGGVAWALDRDGVVWRGDVAIPGSAEAVATLRGRGERVVFLTNNSALTVDDYLAKLGRAGIETAPDDILTSAQAAAGLLEPGERALVVGGPGIVEALGAAKVDVVPEGPADAVVVGWDRAFDYAELTLAMRTVRGGARLVGTNDDSTYPVPEGLLPGGGSILAAVAYASDATATVAGKPYQPMADLVAARVGPVDVLVGDRPSTDGLMARRLGTRFALVLSGVTSRNDLPVDPEPDVVADDLASLVRDWRPQ
jgi:4-nitrophenyl phosphatase